MDKIGKWLMIGLIAAEVALVWIGVLDLRSAIGIVVAIEVVLFLVASRQLIAAIRGYQRSRIAGIDSWRALEDGLSILLPRPIARIAVLEPRLWAVLALWLSRRYRPGTNDFCYHKRSPVGPMLLVVVLTAPVELLLFELLIPWAWLRWLLVAGTIYAVVWAFGYYASMVVLPHRLEATGIRLRYGILAEASVPYNAIATMELVRQRSPGSRDGLRIVRADEAAYLAVGGYTSITLRLGCALPVRGIFGPTHLVSEIHLAADEPARLVRELGQACSEASGLPAQSKSS